MGEVDTKPFESVQAALCLFEEKSDQRKHRSNSGEGKLDSEEKDVDLLLKDLANYKLQVEVIDSAYKQALLKLDIYQQVVDEISTKLKNSEAAREKYYEECAEARSCANELESKTMDLTGQLAETEKAKEEILDALEKSKAVEEELVAAQQELKAMKELKSSVTTHAEQMELAVSAEKEKNKELLECITELKLRLELELSKRVDKEINASSLETELENANGEVIRLSGVVEMLTDELNRLRGDMDEITARESAARAEIAVLKSERHSGRLRIAAAEAGEAKANGAAQQLAIEADAAKKETRRLQQGNSFAFSSQCDDYSQDLQVTTPRLRKLVSFTEEGRDGFDPQIMISMLEYESLIRRAEKADQTAIFPTQVALNLIAYDGDSDFVILNKKLEASMAEVKELKQYSEKAVHRAEMAERAKEAVEEQLRKWREQKQRRRVALASFRNEPMQKERNPARLDKTASMYEALPLGKVLKMQV